MYITLPFTYTYMKQICLIVIAAYVTNKTLLAASRDKFLY